MSTTHERPGVYSSYDASSVIYGSSGAKIVGIAAPAVSGEANVVTLVTSGAEAAALYGSGNGTLTELIAAALGNGASAVVACPVAIGSAVPTTADYTAAFTLLGAREDVDILICGSGEQDVQVALKQSVEESSGAQRERIGVAAGTAEETVSQLVTRAAALNSERMVLVAPCALNSDGTKPDTGILAAAAVAGAIAAENDPAVPLGGAELSGLGGLAYNYTDSELDVLIRGGVTVLESVGGTVSVIRGITTRTTTSGAADATWRELSTILIVDDVIPDVRDALRSRFLRVKNTAQTRDAIASQTILILEDKVSREIIDSYGQVTVTADSEDPTLCLVDFHFTVTHGLNQIHIAAHITV